MLLTKPLALHHFTIACGLLGMVCSAVWSAELSVTPVFAFQVQATDLRWGSEMSVRLRPRPWPMIQLHPEDRLPLSITVQGTSGDDDHWTGFGDNTVNGVNGPVNDLLVYGGRLIAVGSFDRASSRLMNCVAAWDGHAWFSLAGGLTYDQCPSGFPCNFAYCAEEYLGDLVVGGSFQKAGGVPANFIARWDGTAWHAFPQDFDSSVGELTLYQGDLIAAGPFTYAGTQPVGHVARWDGSVWHAMGSGLDRAPLALLEYEGALIAGGGFTRSGTTRLQGIARWDGTEWQPLGESMSSVFALGVFQGHLLADVTLCGDGGPSCGLSQWTGSAWSPLAGGYMSANAMITYPDSLIVMGGGSRRNNIARWSGSSWLPLGSGLDDLADCAAVWEGSLYVGGVFKHAGGKTSNHIARWDDVITPVTLEDFVASSTPEGIRLDWRLPLQAGQDLESLSVQRAASEAGPYVDLRSLTPQPVMTFLDPDVVAGQRLWYRLRFTLHDGSEEASRSVSVLIPASARTAFLYAPVDRPPGGPVELRFKLMGASTPIQLVIYDVRGRAVKMWQHTCDPGVHSVLWDRRTDGGGRVSRGLYFVRLQVPGIHAITKRLVLLHR